MRLASAVASLLLAAAASGQPAAPVYLDELVEMPLATLQQRFPTLKSEGCYALADAHFLHITIHKKEQKPWRVTLAADTPCKRPEQGPVVDIRSRSGILLGDTVVRIVERLGRPDASAAPNPDQRRLGDIEYFYICRVSDGCARHTSIFVKDGAVTAISEWYSD